MPTVVVNSPKISVDVSLQKVTANVNLPNSVGVQIKPISVLAVVKKPNVAVGLDPPIVKEYVGAEPYEGSYTVTPSEETQTLYTNTKRMLNDVVIAPIPTNYGKITWNGSTLTVS